jgi:ribosomal protein L29
MTKNISPLTTLKLDFAKMKLSIKAGKEKNTNAHKKIKLEIARLLTSKTK